VKGLGSETVGNVPTVFFVCGFFYFFVKYFLFPWIFIIFAADYRKLKNMKNYEVTLLLVINPSRDMDLNEPETKRVEFNVDANSEDEARSIAKELDTSGLSVWESWAIEN
jgi:hypothetical protein